MPWSIGHALLSTPEYEIPISSGMVGLGSDSLWERVEGSRLIRVSGAAAPPKQALASSIQGSAWGMGHCDYVRCQGLPGASGAWGYLCQTFSDRACYLSPLITVVLTWRCALPPSPGDM